MRAFLFAAALLLAAVPASAQTPIVARAELISYGVYTANSTNCVRDERGVLRCQLSDVRHALTTRTIPAEPGVMFGVSFRIIGAPEGDLAQLRKVWRFPEPGLRSPTVADPIRRLERMESRIIGGEAVATYRFDDNWELAPGVWRLEFWQDDRLLLAQDFTIVAPDAQPAH